MISSSFLFQFASWISLLDLNAVFWSQQCSILLFNFIIHVSMNFVTSLNHICSSLKMMLYSWSCFLCCYTQTVLSTTTVFSYSDSYWCSVSNTFSLFNSFIHSAHSSVNDTLSTSFFLFWVLLWTFFRTCSWTVYLC